MQHHENFRQRRPDFHLDGFFGGLEGVLGRHDTQFLFAAVSRQVP
jgi:hypothetical protein